MYSEELEEVIEAALADGVIKDKERAVLHKRAEAEGVDCDELDMVLESRLAKKKKEEERQRPIPPIPVESTKMGNVMKCPNCGEPYQPGAYKCAACGHVFQNLEANRSTVKFAEGIQKLMVNSRTMGFWSSERLDQISSYIANFPIPSTKDDMLEFMFSLKAKTTGNDHVKITAAYNAKLKETIAKAKILFADDPQVQAAVQEVTKFKISNIPYVVKLLIFLVVAMVLMFLVFHR